MGLSRSLSLASKLLLGCCLLATAAHAADARLRGEALDKEVTRLMQAAHVPGLALAVIENGKIVHLQAYGQRDVEQKLPLTVDTVMYAASITKAAFAYATLSLLDQGKLDLDASIARLLPKPLPDYDKYADLADDPRWRAITPRMLLTHSAGFANFAFVEPDGKLRIHFAPGSRYAYSGEGLILLQFVLERGLGLDVGQEMQRRVFDRFGMRRTSMMWRDDFAANLADGWTLDGSVVPHDERSRVRAAGSMDTTIADLAKFAAGYVDGEGLAPQHGAALTAPQLAIGTASQFPTLQPLLPDAQRRADVAAGLGVVVFGGPQGPGFMKGGHDDATGNMLVCVKRGRRCVVILSNDVRAEAAFPQLIRYVLGETGAALRWEYGDMRFVE